MPLFPPRPASSMGELPRSTSSLESVLSCSSKSSLSASRLSSNSLLSPVPGLFASDFFTASVLAESLPDDFGAESLAELPPLITALLGPASRAISSVGIASGSLALFFFLGILPTSSRTSESPEVDPLGLPVLGSSAESEKMSSSEASNASGSSAAFALPGFALFSTLKSSEPCSAESIAASGSSGSLAAPSCRPSSSIWLSRKRSVGPSRMGTRCVHSVLRRRLNSSIGMPSRFAASSSVIN